jgi:hypothetical protein
VRTTEKRTSAICAGEVVEISKASSIEAMNLPADMEAHCDFALEPMHAHVCKAGCQAEAMKVQAEAMEERHQARVCTAAGLRYDEVCRPPRRVPHSRRHSPCAFMIRCLHSQVAGLGRWLAANRGVATCRRSRRGQAHGATSTAGGGATSAWGAMKARTPWAMWTRQLRDARPWQVALSRHAAALSVCW